MFKHYHFGFWYGRVRWFRAAKSRQWLKKYLSPLKVSSGSRNKVARWVGWQRFRLSLRLELLLDYLAGFDTRFFTKRSKWVKVLLGGKWPEKPEKRTK